MAKSEPKKEKEIPKPPKFFVRVCEIKAALLFASQDESRYVLNGVNIRTRGNLPPVLVATDGCRFCCIESQADQELPNGTESLSTALGEMMRTSPGATASTESDAATS